jgi:hypothetical protein
VSSASAAPASAQLTTWVPPVPAGWPPPPLPPGDAARAAWLLAATCATARRLARAAGLLAPVSARPGLPTAPLLTASPWSFAPPPQAARASHNANGDSLPSMVVSAGTERDRNA